MAGQWRRQAKGQQQIGAGSNAPQIVANVFDAVKLVGADPTGATDANTLYKALIPKALLNFKDIAGTITINRAINCTVGFRTGTATGDYQVTFRRPFANVLYGMAFCGLSPPATAQIIVSHNQDNVLKSVSAWNFYVAAGGVLMRPPECNLIFYGDQ